MALYTLQQLLILSNFCGNPRHDLPDVVSPRRFMHAVGGEGTVEQPVGPVAHDMVL